MPVHIRITRTSPEGEALYQQGELVLSDEAYEKLKGFLRATVLEGDPDARCRCGHRTSTHTHEGCRYADSEGLCLCSEFVR